MRVCECVYTENRRPRVSNATRRQTDRPAIANKQTMHDDEYVGRYSVADGGEWISTGLRCCCCCCCDYLLATPGRRRRAWPAAKWAPPPPPPPPPLDNGNWRAGRARAGRRGEHLAASASYYPPRSCSRNAGVSLLTVLYREITDGRTDGRTPAEWCVRTAPPRRRAVLPIYDRPTCVRACVMERGRARRHVGEW